MQKNHSCSYSGLEELNRLTSITPSLTEFNIFSHFPLKSHVLIVFKAALEPHVSSKETSILGGRLMTTVMRTVWWSRRILSQRKVWYSTNILRDSEINLNTVSGMNMDYWHIINVMIVRKGNYCLTVMHWYWSLSKDWIWSSESEEVSLHSVL